MGKGWAKGLSAATDARVARMAQGHRGRRYERRTPVELCRWPAAGRRTLALQWSDEMAYVVGLTATDGCLATGRKLISFKSGDLQLVETYRDLLGRTNRIGTERTLNGGVAYRIQFTDARFYEWLLDVGLMPRKSLVLGAIDVPADVLLPLARGLLDGDGSVINRRYRADTGRRPDYFWEYLITRFQSASWAHLDWLRARLLEHAGVRGYLHQVNLKSVPRRHPFFSLRYGKRASLVLLPKLYPAGAPCLARKRAIWDAYAALHT